MKKKTGVIIIAALLFVFGLNFWFAEITSINAASSGTVNADYVNVRTGPGTSYKVLQYKKEDVRLDKGTKVQILAEKSGWYQVSFSYEKKTLKGYIRNDFIKKASTTPSSAAPSVSSTGLNIPAKVTATSLKVRKSASANGAQLTIDGTAVVLKKGTAVKILKEKTSGGKKWYYVSFTYKKTAKKGYVSADYVKLTLSKKVSAQVSSSSKAKIYKGVGTQTGQLTVGTKKVSLSNKTGLIIKKEANDKNGAKWYQVSFTYSKKERTGYIPASKTVLTGIYYETGTVNTEGLNVRTGAGTNYARLTYNNKNVLLSKGTKVTILGQKKVGNVIWYKVRFSYGSATLEGYVSGDYIIVGEAEEPSTTPNPSEKPAESPDTTQKPEEEPSKSPEASEEPIDQGEYGAYLSSLGFPDSYINALCSLHESRPKWKFKVYQTGLDWDTVIASETKIGLNLISNSKTTAWKSYETGAYNWATNSFIPYDGSSWVTASKEAVAYYMDPRNFLSERSILQFEALEYQEEYQTKEGIENILKNTPMYKKEFTYTSDSGKNESMLYSEAFIEAAKESGVSPYHLASRVKQEVVTSQGFSNSASGTVSGYESIYNFYNIGANNSTAASGAVINGLKFARGDSSSAALKEKFLLPWDNQYKAIVGGAKYIGSNYINRGQNTVYLQKFNVTATSRYSHQYMANVEAGLAESSKMYTAYADSLDTPIVFSIPVYENMPAKNAAAPSGDAKNPNNWLKTLRIGNYTMTPKFNVTDGGEKTYQITVDDSSISEVSLTATTVCDVAAIKVQVTANGKTTQVSNTGNAQIPLKDGENRVEIIVTAETGDKNIYEVTITKE